MSTAFYPLGMISYTNRANREGYVSWKGTGDYANPTSLTAGNIRPLTNNDPTNDTAYSHGIPRPIKHYRKGFLADPSRHSGTHVSISQAMETPGAFVQSVDCNESFGNTLISNWSPIVNLTHKPQPDKQHCIGNEAKKALSRVRSANTILKPNYYQTSAELLYNRGSTFDQAESHYRPHECDTKCENQFVYKPSNARFAQQGAVSSSTRLLDIQRTAINSQSNKTKKAPCVQYRRTRI
jgi:hypothetical protein